MGHNEKKREIDPNNVVVRAAIAALRRRGCHEDEETLLALAMESLESRTKRFAEEAEKAERRAIGRGQTVLSDADVEHRKKATDVLLGR